MTFEQQLLRELHHLNKNLVEIKKSLDKLKGDPILIKVPGWEDQEESTTSYSWDGETDE